MILGFQNLKKNLKSGHNGFKASERSLRGVSEVRASSQEPPTERERRNSAKWSFQTVFSDLRGSISV